MNIIMFVLGAALSVLFCILYFTNSKKYEVMVNAVDESVFIMKDILPVGLALCTILRINTKKMSLKKRRKLSELYTEQYVEFYNLVSISANISYLTLFFALSFLVGAMANSFAIAVLFIVISLLMPIYVNMTMDTRIKERREELLLDYPTVLSNMALFINAGLPLREAWDTVAKSGTRKLYVEMQRTSTSIHNGESEISAFTAFGAACKINELKKFASIICQNVQKGNSEMVQVMKQLSLEAWNAKKSIAVSRGKNAETLLIIPVGITFVAILAMVLIPIMTNMSF